MSRLIRILLFILILLGAVPVLAQDADADYEKVLRLIKRAKLSEATELELRLFDLKEIPSELWQLTHLQQLETSGDQLAILPPEIGQLTELQRLTISPAALVTLPPEI